MPSRVIRGEINRSDSLSHVSVEAELTFDRLLLAVAREHGLGVSAVGVGEETATESAKVDSGKADRVAEMVEELMPDERRLERECPLRW